MNLRARLIASFVLLAGLLSASGFYVSLRLRTVSNGYAEVINHTDLANSDMADVQIAVAQSIAALNGYAALQNNEWLDAFERNTAVTKQKIKVAHDRAAVADQPRLDEMAALYDQYLDIGIRVIGLVNQGEHQEAVTLLDHDGLPVIEKIQAAAGSIRETYRTKAVAAGRGAVEEANRSQEISYAVIGLSLVLACAMALFLARSLSAPVRQMAALVQRVAAGDLTVTVDHVRTRDEIGEVMDGFNRMVQNLRGLINGIGSHARDVQGIASNLLATSRQTALTVADSAGAVGEVALGAQEQAQASAEVERTLDEVQQAISQIATGAQATAGEAQNASELQGQMLAALGAMADSAAAVAAQTEQTATAATSGAQVVQQTLEAIERIRSAVAESARCIRDLEQITAQMDSVTSVISAVADQTNLLALNAAIEAARAGEQGRGFGVVAQEVRALAERSSASAHNISELIRSLQDQTRQAVMVMSAGSEEADRGSRLAGQASGALDEILVAMTSTSGSIGEIAGAASQVRTQAERVAQTFTMFAAITEENTAATEQMTAGAVQASHNMQGIAARADQNAAAAALVAASMDGLAVTAKEMAASAQVLSGVAQGLEAQVARFVR